MSTNLQLHPAIQEPVIAATHSFLAGFVVNSVTTGAVWRGGNVAVGLTGGLFSVAASLIDSALRPLISRLFDAHGDSECFQWITRTVLVLSILSVIAVPYTSAFGVDVGINVISSIFARTAVYLISGFVENQVVVIG